MDQIAEYVQLAANGFALAVAGWIYAAYVKNLRAMVSAKDEQLNVLERNLALWKDKAAEFEKKTPEYIEDVLSKRIKLREEEIRRLDQDREAHTKLVSSKTREVARLKEELEKSIQLNRALTYYDVDSDEDVVIPESDIELVELGEVFVDSASLLISDPMYVEKEWRKDVEFLHDRVYRHVDTGREISFPEDFQHYDDAIEGLEGSVNELIAAGKLIQVEVERELTYSYPGAAYASMSKEGFGVLKFENGNEGAGICVRTVYGDGLYPVYGEMYKGAIFRVYIELQ